MTTPDANVTHGASVAGDADGAPTAHGATGARPSKGALTRSAILDTTVELLDAHGEQGLRMADVTRRSGVSIGSIYHHFGDRDGLIKAARARQFEASHPTYGAVVAELAGSARTAEEFVAGLRELIRYVQDRERGHDRLQRLAYLASAASRPALLEELRSQQTALIDAGVELAQGLIDRGWLKDGVSARALVTLNLALELGAIVADLDAKRVDDEEWFLAVQLATASLFRLDAAG